MKATRKKGPRFVPVEDAPGDGLSDRAREFLALLLIGACLFALLALATFDASTLDAPGIPRGGARNLGGLVGYAVADAMTFLLGYAAWIPFVAGVAYGVLMFVGRRVHGASLKLLGVVVLAAMVALLLAGSDGAAPPTRLAPHGPGGAFGANLSPKLYHAFGGSGRILLLLFGALCSLLLATQWLVSELLLKLADGVQTGARSLRAPAVALAGAAARVGVPGRLRTGAAAGAAPRTVEGEGDAGDAEESETGESDTDAPGDRAAAADDEPGAAAAAARPPERRGLGWLRRRRDRSVRAAAEGGAAADDPVAIEAPEPHGDAGDGGEPDDSEPPEQAIAGDAAAPAAGDSPRAPRGPSRPPARATTGEPRRAKTRPPKRRRSPPAEQPELLFDHPYPFPPLELFRAVPHHDTGETQRVLDRNKQAIEARLASFKLDAQVVAASVGPAVTQYEVRLGEGIKLSRVHAYEADLAAALRAVSVRVVAPIPGKDTVGIEVPNTHRQMVTFRELLEQHAGAGDDLAIPLFLGKDVAGEAIVEDLAKMPHLLIAGTTGSGKSVCVNSILMSILATRTPQQCRLILIDPKMVELQVFRRVPHLACDVVTNMKRAPQVLEWAVDEMERRYALLSAAGTNHIRSYNRLGKDVIEQRSQRPLPAEDAHLPYMVIVIDELADLMNVAQKDVEESIQRLAQKSRAVGLHVILATQRPSTDVITGVIKANLPCQIAFKVNRKIDSRVILDVNGAEKLLGHGDMLFVSPSAHQIVRAQGAFVSEEEALAVCSWLEQHAPEPDFLPALVQTETGSGRRPQDQDELYGRAVEIVLGQQRGSATLIQRALAVGYNRATRLLEMMEDDGLVGPFVGSKSREVMMSLEEWREREAAIAAELDAAGEPDGDGFADGDGAPDDVELGDGELDGDDDDWEVESDDDDGSARAGAGR
ncbi:MAG: DNA translocase FtsK 4TM domain-containing protein [Planctomycetes bacterium]|nr:DNA translocase FtsK 4TM domain-containing protein [Planctomycetota bacterium]